MFSSCTRAYSDFYYNSASILSGCVRYPLQSCTARSAEQRTISNVHLLMPVSIDTSPKTGADVDARDSLTEPLNNMLGRKGTIILTCVFSFASCLGQAFVKNQWQLLICRLLLGFGIGPKTATIPIYAAESAPQLIRGAMVMQVKAGTGSKQYTISGTDIGYSSNSRQPSASWQALSYLTSFEMQ